jgi:hypothetical protein
MTLQTPSKDVMLVAGSPLQHMHEVVVIFVFKTLTSGRIRTLLHRLSAWSVDPDLGIEGGGVGIFLTKRSGWYS